MNDQPSESVDAATIDTGEPIAALRGLEEPATVTFGEILRRRIHRRRLGADLGRLGWDGPVVVVVELLSVIFGLLGLGHGDEGKER